MDEIVVPAIASFGAELVVVSAGYDAHARDPVCAMRLTAGAFFRLARRVLDLAPVVAVLEGGYDLDGLRWGVAATLEAMAGGSEPVPVPEQERGALPGSEQALRWVDDAKAAVRGWRPR